ncbi:MAG: hypothetical protein GXO30_01705, partial [Epsilonproteobacteria bacterium]|nr:hypothetical protein [Campylobacterota bacterium]
MKVVIFSVLVLLFNLIFTTGCGKSNAMLSNHMDKVQKRNQQKYGSVHSASPDFISLVQKAPTQRSRYILELASKFDKNPDSIATKTIDPLKDKEAKLKIDAQWVKQKRKMIIQAKKNGQYNSNYIGFLKNIQRSLYKPYKVVTDIPPYIQEVKIPSANKANIGNNVTLDIQTLTTTFIIPQNKSSLELQKEITQEFDKVLPKHDWKRIEKFSETTYEETIKDCNDLIAIYKQRLKELPSSDTQQIDSISKNIKKLQNLLKDTQKKLKTAKAEDVYTKSVVLYMYYYKGDA